MPEVVMKAPIFTTLLRSNEDAKRKVVVLTFGTADMTKFEIEISTKCAPLAIVALVTHLGKLASTLPESEREQLQAQPIRCVGVTPAVGHKGSPALVLRLEGGAELPLEFSQESLAKIASALQELATAGDRSRYH
jgi:hypothetical protein